jgi:hypothetical protein
LRALAAGARAVAHATCPPHGARRSVRLADGRAIARAHRRYMTPMSFDVLTFTVLSHLSSPQKTQLKTDGLNVSLWMQSLSSFCGSAHASPSLPPHPSLPSGSISSRMR